MSTENTSSEEKKVLPESKPNPLPQPEKKPDSKLSKSDQVKELLRKKIDEGFVVN